jgi:hypothetical protein
MSAAVHFLLVAGITIVSIMGATFALDALGVPQVAGFGWDDVLLGTITAAGTVLGMALLRKVA